MKLFGTTEDHPLGVHDWREVYWYMEYQKIELTDVFCQGRRSMFLKKGAGDEWQAP